MGFMQGGSTHVLIDFNGDGVCISNGRRLAGALRLHSV